MQEQAEGMSRLDPASIPQVVYDHDAPLRRRPTHGTGDGWSCGHHFYHEVPAPSIGSGNPEQDQPDRLDQLGASLNPPGSDGTGVEADHARRRGLCSCAPGRKHSVCWWRAVRRVLQRPWLFYGSEGFRGSRSRRRVRQSVSWMLIPTEPNAPQIWINGKRELA
jgi:hypothetical protein